MPTTAKSILLLIRNNGQIEKTNQYTLDLLQYKAPNEIIGKHVSLLLPNAESFVPHFQPASTSITELIGSSQRKILAKIDVTPFTDGYLITGCDLSDQSNLVKSQQQEILELKSLNKDLQNFAAIASHELMEPVRMIHSFTSLLQRKYGQELDDSGLEFLSYIVGGSTRLINLVQILTRVSRISNFQIEKEKVDFRSIIKDVKSNLMLKIKKNKASITYPKEVPVFQANRVQLIQVFQNLIANSIKFKSKENPIIEIKYELQKKFLHFSIKDNGRGIEKEAQAFIFELFKRKTNKKNKTKGSGIGLAICKKIINLHGGKIWVESSLKNGATFHFTLATD